MECISYVGQYPTKSGKSILFYSLYKCSYCGKEVARQSSRGERLNSCGCTHGSKKHGEEKTILYGRWRSMKERCNNKKSKDYCYYGKRGIKVCKEWKKDFLAFKSWALVNGYKEKLQIDRIDNDGDYTPENCRWTTGTINLRNSRLAKINIEKARQIRYLCKTTNYTQKEIGKAYSISGASISSIIRNETWKEVVT